MWDHGTYYDMSKLYKAWRKYYNEMGLSANKIIKVVQRKVNKRKAPPGQNIEDLIRATNCDL